MGKQIKKPILISKIHRKIEQDYIPKRKCIEKYGMDGRDYTAVMNYLPDRITLKRCEQICVNLNIKQEEL